MDPIEEALYKEITDEFKRIEKEYAYFFWKGSKSAGFIPKSLTFQEYWDGLEKVYNV